MEITNFQVPYWNLVLPGDFPLPCDDQRVSKWSLPMPQLWEEHHWGRSACHAQELEELPAACGQLLGCPESAALGSQWWGPWRLLGHLGLSAKVCSYRGCWLRWLCDKGGCVKGTGAVAGSLAGLGSGGLLVEILQVDKAKVSNWFPFRPTSTATMASASASCHGSSRCPCQHLGAFWEANWWRVLGWEQEVNV